MIVDEKYKFNKELVYRDRDSILLVFNEELGGFMELNESARIVFLMCKEEMCYSEIIKNIAKELNIEETVIEQKVY